jgi:hypothetical protein
MLQLPKAVLILVTALLLNIHVQAQESTGIHVVGLTSAERDSLTRELDAAGNIHLAFACVPAGILVFRSNAPGTSRASLRSSAIAAMASMIAPGRIGEAELDQQAAEAACRNARGE